MKFLVKVRVVAVTLLFALTSAAYGITALTVDPTDVAKGAYANGADGNHVFIQTIQMTLTGGWAGADAVVIDIPDDITIADLDVDALYTDEVTVSYDPAGATTYSVTAAAADEITLTSSAAAVAGDIIWLIFPVETAAVPAAGASDDYTITFGAADAALLEGGPFTRTINYEDQPGIITWSAEFEDAGLSGLVETDDRGRYYPELAAIGGAGPSFIVAVTSLPDYFVDLAAFTLVPGGNEALWLPVFTALGADGNDNNDLEYYLWASQDGSLSRIKAGPVDHRVMDADPVGGADPKTYPVGNDNLDLNQAGHTGYLSASLLDEGDWFLYITSDATGDWILGRSDTLRVHHKPVFVDYYDAALGTGALFDDDFDNVGDNTVDGTEVSLTLESGGVIGIDASFNPATNQKSVDVYWWVEDIDENCEVHVYRSTNAALTVTDIDITGAAPNETVTGLNSGEGTKIHTGNFWEESDTAFVTYDVATSDVVYEPAGTYTFYVILNDGDNQALTPVEVRTTGAAVPVTVAHYPYFGWSFYNPAVAGAGPPDWDVNIESATDQYITLSWGNPPTGSTNKDGDTDLDAGGTATISIYAVTQATGDFATITGGAGSEIDDANLVAGVSGGTAWLLTTITDDADSKEDNRYEWDFRNAGLAAGRYFIWAVMEDNGDKILAQFNPDGTPEPTAGGDENDVEFVLTHSEYLRAVTPYAGPPVELDDGDTYRLAWEAFDQDAALAGLIQAVLVNVDAADPGNEDWTLWTTDAAYLTTDFVWVLPITNNGGVPAAGVGEVPADGSAVFDMSILTNTAAGAGDIPEGDYEVWYFFTTAAAFAGTETPIKAPGTIYLSGQTSSPYNISMSPNKASLSPGDILTIDIFATDDGTANNPNMAIFFVEIPNASYFTVIDQDGDASNGVTEPFDNLRGTTTAAPNELLGDVLMNSVETTAEGSYLLGYLEKLAAGSNDVTSSDMVSFQIQMTSAISDPLEDLEIIFTESDDFPTNLYDVDGSAQSTSIPAVALTVRLGQSGILSGVVDVEGQTNEGQVVDFYLTGPGATTPSTNAAYLAANSDADGTDGVQVTLEGGGYYELSGIPTGEYDVMVRKSGYLDVIRPNQRIVSLDNVTLNFTGGNRLYGGDAAGYDDDGDANTASQPDNRVDAEDTDAIADAFGASSGDATWNAYADIDASGEVGINDLFMASKNLGTDGDGVFYKVVPGSNENAMIWLAKADESAEGVTFAVSAEGLSSLSAYSVDMHFSSDDWELVGYADAMQMHSKTIKASRMEEGSALFGSAIAGYNPLRAESAELMAVTLRAKVMDPETPAISKASLVDGNGNLSEALIGGFNAGVPEAFSLSQNYPNPFNPTTNIDFSLPVDGQVKLAVYNLLGEEIHTLVADNLKAGTYKAVWNSQDNMGRKVPSGMYFYRLVVNNSVIATHKMVLLK
jgi:hypothetical protein